MPKRKIIQKNLQDKFYTKPEIALECIKKAEPFIDTNDVVIEPSAGNGSFFNQLPYQNKIGLDIEPEGSGIIKQDWFLYHPPPNCVIIGNPPFGSRNNLSKKFIKHSLNTAKIIAFVLPSVYRKETLQTTFPPNWSLILDHTLPDNSFLLEDAEYHVPCIFQIWCNTSLIKIDLPDLRESKKIPFITDDFLFTDKEYANWFMFGAAPHKIISPDKVMENNRGYYLSCDVIIKEKLQAIDWSTYGLSSVNGGAFWFTKKQILNIYGEVYGKK